MLKINEKEIDEKIHMKISEKIQINLFENPTTGYRWYIEEKVTNHLLYLEQEKFLANSEVEMGSGGIRQWIFRAECVGIVQVSFVLKRIWIQNLQQNRRCNFTVEIT
ncbi:protease inhibitor I42 family protein [Bacillus cereus]|uniref:protease inhibitor I42 family protein n=1 Tax=Bacillus cereus TaxID=1396 RepID=UPI0006AD706A|nr:protease inhibitor I42 family protein [Bacillus cereus]